MPSQKELRETRQKFHQLARESYPNTGEPGTVWVLCEVLGWSWDDVTKTPIEGFSKEGYQRFLTDKDEKPLRKSDGSGIATVSRKWTTEEKKLLRDWWWLLGYER